ncbi:30S ribosomal protein S1 [Linum perenne]
MEALALSTVAVAATTSSSAARSSFTGIQFSLPLPQSRFSRSSRRRRRELSSSRKNRLVVSAASNEPELDEWDLMELKFGRYLGEDPKLTAAKIRAKKLYPNASYLEVEKEFRRNKGKMDEIEELPFEISNDRRIKSSSSSPSEDGLNLNRPVLKQGMKFQEVVRKPAKVLPVMKKPSRPGVKDASDSSSNSVKRSVPNVSLRKPTEFSVDDDDEEDKGFKSGVKMIEPSLMMKMRSERNNVRLTDMTLVRKPEAVSVEKKQESPANVDSTVNDTPLLRKPETMNVEKEQVSPANVDGTVTRGENSPVNVDGEVNDMTLLRKPETMSVEKKQESPANVDGNDNGGDGSATGNEVKDGYIDFTMSRKPVSIENGIQESSKTGSESLGKEEVAEQKPAVGMQQESIVQSNEEEDSNTTDSASKSSIETSLQGKPKRLDKPVKEKPMSKVDQTDPLASGSSTKGDEFQNLPNTSPLEAADWSRAEEMFKSGDRTQVELVSSRTQGFIVSFGSLVGYLPYGYLASRWKFNVFEAWLRQKGFDPSAYKQNAEISDNNDALDKNISLDSTTKPATTTETPGEITSDMKLEDLHKIYDQEKLKFLTSFVGQKIKANIVLADKSSRKLIFSMGPRENEESKKKKRALMDKLKVGDVVQCCIKSITHFGVFVEVEDVPALIHQSEVSWDATLDPASYFQLGQIVEAKVHELDFKLDRISLSLKEMMPDPLAEAWGESIFGDRDPSSGKLQPAEADSEWPEAESLINELEQIDGIQSVTKGRYFLSSGLAPTFQVYMASMVEDEYKLLARAGNKVQEVIVQSSLDNEEMKSVISSCANKV